MLSRIACITLLLLAWTPLPAVADVYNNGPTNGETNSWPLNFGFANSDSFVVNGVSADLTGLQFAAWLFPGDTLDTVEVSITSDEFGGTTYFDQVLSTNQNGCALNNFGFNVCTETADFNLNLPGGTFWVNLSNAVVDNGDPVYWDENSGPSSASENEIGTIYSEAFTLNGTVNQTGTTPEISSILLFGTGAVGLVGILRRKSC
jgi:hypothetical protein